MNASDALRRRLVATLLAGAAFTPLALIPARRAQAADLPLLDPSSAAAKKVNYVPDAAQAKATTKSNTCSSCGMYQGAYGSKQGPCQLFQGKEVLAGGWCSSWEPQM